MSLAFNAIHIAMNIERKEADMKEMFTSGIRTDMSVLATSLGKSIADELGFDHEGDIVFVKIPNQIVDSNDPKFKIMLSTYNDKHVVLLTVKPESLSPANYGHVWDIIPEETDVDKYFSLTLISEHGFLGDMLCKILHYGKPDAVSPGDKEDTSCR